LIDRSRFFTIGTICTGSASGSIESSSISKAKSSPVAHPANHRLNPFTDGPQIKAQGESIRGIAEAVKVSKSFIRKSSGILICKRSKFQPEKIAVQCP
jgi:hypothetical protein